MRKYRLKKEAVTFFKEKYATAIYPIETWDGLGIDMVALEEVEDAYLVFGHESLRPDSKSSSLGGWDQEGSRFYFTIRFPGVKFGEHDKFSNGKVVRELMNKIQRDINNFYSDFVCDSISQAE